MDRKRGRALQLYAKKLALNGLLGDQQGVEEVAFRSGSQQTSHSCNKYGWGRGSASLRLKPESRHARVALSVSHIS